jgi:hypothetical protein
MGQIDSNKEAMRIFQADWRVHGARRGRSSSQVITTISGLELKPGFL